WPVGSLKGRLERGRELLRQRLEKRGLLLPTILAGSLTVPHRLLADTVRAAIMNAGVPALSITMTTRMAVAVASPTLLGPRLGLAMRPAPSAAPAALPPTAAAPRLDALGDPLPPFAIARLGTTRLVDQVGALTFLDGGRQIRSVGTKVRRWDPKTGR